MMPNLAGLAGWLLVGLAAGPEPRDLVARLGAPKFADREAASAALERLGSDAFPALKAARNAPDPEIKSRVELLLEAIERTSVNRARTVRLQGRRYLLAELADAISAAQGVTVHAPDPVDLAPNSRRSLTLDRAEDVGFWPLMDRLGMTIQWDVEQQDTGRGMMMRRTATVRLASPTEPQAAKSDHGPFRVILRPTRSVAEGVPFDARRRIPRGFGQMPPAPQPAAAVGLSLPIELLAEPRLTLRPAGAPRILEALDDEGVSHAGALRGDVDAGNEPFGDRAVSALHMRLKARGDGSLPSRLKTLRGVIPVEVEARRIEPVTIPIPEPGATDIRPVLCGGTTVQVHALTTTPFSGRGAFSLDLTLRRDGWSLGQIFGRRFNGRNWNKMMSDTETFWDSLEVVDAEGHAFRPGSPRPIAAENDTARFLYAVPPREDAEPPAEVRIYGTLKTTLEVPFTFRDVRLRGEPGE